LVIKPLRINKQRVEVAMYRVSLTPTVKSNGVVIWTRYFYFSSCWCYLLSSSL